MNLKKFDIELAKAGAKVVTRDGKPVRIICYDRIIDSKFPLIGLIYENNKESLTYFSYEGNYTSFEHKCDLFMAPTNKKGWINIYPRGECSYIYTTKEEAEIGARDNVNRIDCIEIEYNAE